VEVIFLSQEILHSWDRAMTTVLLTVIEAGTNYYVALEVRTVVEATYASF